MEENKKKVSSREAWRLHRRAAKLFYAERPALHAVNWLYAAFKSLSPYVLIYLSAQIIGELTGTRDAHRLTVLAVAAVAAASLLPLITAALERRQTVLYDNSFYINQKIYANKLLDMDFPQLDDPKTHDDLSQILQNEKWSGYGLGRVLDVETKLPMSVFGVLGVVALTVTLFTQRVPGKRRGVDGAEPSAVSARLLAAACSALGAAVAVHEPRLDAHGRARAARAARQPVFQLLCGHGDQRPRPRERHPHV